MSRSSHILIAAVLCFLGVTPVWAQTSMLRGTVVDSAKKPIPGAQVTITSEQLGSYREVFTTNKKGKFIVRFQPNQLQYTFELLFEAPGYQSFTQPLSPSATRQMKEEFVMEEGETQEVQSMGDLGAVFSGAANEAIEAFNAGLNAQKAGDFAVAESKYKEAIAADEDLGPAHIALSQVLLDQKKYDEALAQTETALTKPVSRADALQVRFQALRALGRQSEADAIVAELQSAEAAVVSAKRVYNEGGQAFQAGDKATALAKFQEAAKLDPSLMDAHHAVGTLLLANGDHAGAAESAEKALALGSDNIDTLRVLYDAYDSLGKTDELMDIAPRLAAVDPEFGGSKLLEQAGALWNNGDTERAVTLAKQALAIDDTLAKAYYFIGLDNLTKGNNAEAKASLQRFIQMAPEDSEAAAAKEMLTYIQ